MKNDYIYVLYNKSINSFFGGFSCRFTSFFHKAKLFYDVNYARRFLSRYSLDNDFRVYSLSALSSEVLYA